MDNAQSFRHTSLQAIQNVNFTSMGMWCTAALSFVIPISTSLTSVFMAIVLLLWSLSPNIKQRWTYYKQHPLTPYLWAFIAVVFAGLFYTSADKGEAFAACKDALRLGFVPILMFYLQSDKAKLLAGKAFVLAMGLTLILGYCKVYGGLPIGEKYTVGAVFKSHIKTSYFMAVAAFMVLVYFLADMPKRAWLIVVIVAMLHYLFFLSAGRIGHLTLFVLGVVLAWRLWRVKGLLVSVIALGLLFVLAYQFSTVFSNRIDLLKQDWAFYQEGGRLKESSLGSRIQFAKSSLEIYAMNPIFGIGTGAYANAYEQFHQGEKTLLTVNPHNEYLRMMVESGVLGLIALLALFLRQWHLTSYLPNKPKDIAQCVLMSFYVGCLLNSWLADFTEAYFYCLFTAVMFAGLTKASKESNRKSQVNQT